MNFDSTGLRQRKGITKLVEELDIFEKVVENVKEEKKVSAGLISFICFSIIFFLFCTETYSFFFKKTFDYRFTVDTAMEETPMLDMDLVVNTPCKYLDVDSSMDEFSGDWGLIRKSPIQKSPTRFEFTDEEQMYWTILRHAHAQYNKQGLRGLEQLEYIDDSVEKNLEAIADEKQNEEATHIKEKRKKNPQHDKVALFQMYFVNNGMGMLQIVSNSENDGESEESACRVHGKFKVRKGVEEKIQMAINAPMMHFDMSGKQTGNISHRIEKFNFGPRIPGLVTPLAGAEHISENGQDVYRYFIKVVPTKIYGFFSYTMAYQYAVTFLKKKLKSGDHSHGAIFFEYEFTGNVIEVRRASITLISYLTRLCSILGGVYATSTIINNLVQYALSFLYPNETFEHESRTNLSNDTQTSLIIDANIQVH